MTNEYLPKNWSARERARYLKELSETTYDVLIIGGGITGAGVLRACGLSGIRAALVEKEDFAFGTSSKSTRLAHGGARYIANGEFGLVWEETHERDWLRGAFPNLARPIPIVWSDYSPIESAVMRGYFAVYDGLSGFGNYKNTHHLSRSEVLKREPDIAFPKLHSGELLYECIINDARLTIEIVKEGVRLGGTALNYVKALKVIYKDGKAAGIEAIDRLTGDTLVIAARNVVNASGPWTDDLLPDGRPPLMRPSKGVHLVVRRESIGNRGGLYVKSPVDGRGVFVLPHGDYTYVGTTDTEYSGDLDECYAETKEYDYFKGIVDNAFPDADFDPEDLVGSYAGSRPLVKKEGVSETKTSRREFVEEAAPGFFVLTGGKLTIFRTMADKLLGFMGKRGAAGVTGGSKADSRVPFAVGMPKDQWDKIRPSTDLDEKTVISLWENYGRGGIAILESVKKDASLGQRIAAEQHYILAELDYCINYEMITRARDFLLRRTNLSLHQRDDHKRLGEVISRHMAKHLGWDEKRIKRETDDYADIAHKNRFFLKTT
ncbi:MAG: glycerol-3-phosphate dehydrogenase/oxidase [Deltaproteobacteria bacterium]|nr:glycerol-3-phosphate dehydrogenase/oxidase [Candidatus Zymogenaceae bacterium]